jgi:hypothetical protein
MAALLLHTCDTHWDIQAPVHTSKANTDNTAALTAGSRWRSGGHHHDLLHREKEPGTESNSRLSGSERFGEERNLFPLPRFESRIVQFLPYTLPKSVYENCCFYHEYFTCIFQAFSMSDITQTPGGEGIGCYKSVTEIYKPAYWGEGVGNQLLVLKELFSSPCRMANTPGAGRAQPTLPK